MDALDLAPDPEVAVVVDVVDLTEPDLLLRLKISAPESSKFLQQKSKMIYNDFQLG